MFKKVSGALFTEYFRFLRFTFPALKSLFWKYASKDYRLPK